MVVSPVAGYTIKNGDTYRILTTGGTISARFDSAAPISAILTPVLTMVAIFAVTRLHFFSYFNAQTDARLRDYLHGVGLGVADYPGVGWLKACCQTSLSCAVILQGVPLCVGAMCALVNPDRSVVLALDAAFTITSPWQVLRAVFTSTALGGLVAVVQLLRYWPVDGQVPKSSVKRVI